MLVRQLLEQRMDAERARELARLLATGVWTHDHPLMAPELEQLGLPVRVGVPDEERALMNFYPQPRGRPSGVEYVPGRPMTPGYPRGATLGSGAARRARTPSPAPS